MSSDAELTEVERALGVTLPADYRTFVRDGRRLVDDPEAPARLFAPRDLLAAQAELVGLEGDARLLVIGKLDDEAFVLLDRRRPRAATWAVSWADELDGADGTRLVSWSWVAKPGAEQPVIRPV